MLQRREKLNTNPDGLAIAYRTETYFEFKYNDTSYKISEKTAKSIAMDLDSFLTYFPIQLNGEIYLFINEDDEQSMTDIEMAYLRQFYNNKTEIKLAATFHKMPRSFNILTNPQQFDTKLVHKHANSFACENECNVVTFSVFDGAVQLPNIIHTQDCSKKFVHK